MDKTEVMGIMKDTLQFMFGKVPENSTELSLVLFEGMEYLDRRMEGPNRDPLYYSGVGK